MTTNLGVLKTHLQFLPHFHKEEFYVFISIKTFLVISILAVIYYS